MSIEFSQVQMAVYECANNGRGVTGGAERSNRYDWTLKIAVINACNGILKRNL